MPNFINLANLSQAELLLWRSGITEPGEIIVENIAATLNAQIIIRPMDGCDARLIKDEKGAIISINQMANRQRQRFSIAHEIGHLINDFGRRGYLCAKSDILEGGSGQSPSEAKADYFASQLLLPSYLFNPIFDALPHNLRSIQSAADTFNASITATAIKAIHRFNSPTVLVHYTHCGRKWFFANGRVPAECYPVKQIHHELPEFDQLFSTGMISRKSISEARFWFPGQELRGRKIIVESFKPQVDSLLVLLSIQ